MSIVTPHAITRSDAHVLANLFELYVHDTKWTAFHFEPPTRDDRSATEQVVPVG